MTPIQQDDLIESVRAALQYISFYHPVDYIENLARAYELEQSPAAKDAMKQILVNSRMCAEGHRPICQDTGIVTDLHQAGHGVPPGSAAMAPATMTLQEMCDEGVREAWLDPDNKLRGSILADPAFARKNTKDNTPCVVEVSLVQGDDGGCDGRGQGRRQRGEVEVRDAESVRLGGGLGVEDGADDGRGLVPAGDAGHRARRHGGKGDAAGQAGADGRDRHAGAEGSGGCRTPLTNIEKMRMEIYDKVNALGIGAQGLGGLTTVLDVKILDWPTHAANLPVAMIPNCAATRHAHFVLDGVGPVYLDPPSLEHWPKLTYDPHGGKRVDLDTVTREDMKSWKPGEVLLLNGKLLTGRDAAHKRMTDMLDRGRNAAGGFHATLYLLRRPGGRGARRGRGACGADHGDAHG